MCEVNKNEQFHSLVDDMLTYMSLAIVGKNTTDAIRASYFDRAEPATTDFAELMYPEDPPASRSSGPDRTLDELLLLAKPTLTRSAVDHAYVTSVGSPDHRSPDHAYGLVRLRQVTAKQARGRLERSCQLNFLLARACVRRDGVIDRAVFNYAGYSQGSWVTEPVARDVEANLTIKRDVERHSKICTLLQIVSEPQWKVCIGWDGMPRVAFNTDSVGAREVFRLRDIPNGRDRRSALRHWVTQHWRERSEGSRGEVRRHLRGATEFSWNGLRCRIEPSIADREENMEVVQVVAPHQLEALLGDASSG